MRHGTPGPRQVQTTHVPGGLEGQACTSSMENLRGKAATKPWSCLAPRHPGMLPRGAEGSSEDSVDGVVEGTCRV